MPYTIGQYKRDVARGVIKNPKVWTYQKVIDWQAKTRKSRELQIPYAGYLTAEQQRAAAAQQAQSLVSADVAAINAMRPGIIQQGERSVAAELAAARDLSMALQPIAGQVQTVWNNAASQSADFARGFSDALRAQLGESAAEANTVASQFGQQGVVDSSTQAADALYGASGYVPARSLAASGAGFASAAAMLPATALSQGNLYAADRRADTRELLAKLDEEIAKAKVNRGEYLQKGLEYQAGVQGDLFDRYIRSRAQAASEQALGLDVRETVAEITGVDPVTGQPTADVVEEKKDAAAKKAENRAKAVKRAQDALTKSSNSASVWLKQQTGKKVRGVVGEEPIKLGTVNGLPMYQGKDGRPTGDVNLAKTKPVYGYVPQKVTPALYRKWVNAVTARLKREVGGRYGFSEAKLREIAKQILLENGVEQPPAQPKKPPTSSAAERWSRSANRDSSATASGR